MGDAIKLKRWRDSGCCCWNSVTNDVKFKVRELMDKEVENLVGMAFWLKFG